MPPRRRLARSPAAGRPARAGPLALAAQRGLGASVAPGVAWPRPLRPRTPHDCPGCRAALATPAPPAAPTPVLPWRAPRTARWPAADGRHRGLRLPQPGLPVRRRDRCRRPRPGRRRPPRPRPHPGLPLPGVRHEGQRPPRHGAVSAHHAGRPGQPGADRAGRGPRSARRQPRLRPWRAHPRPLADAAAGSTPSACTPATSTASTCRTSSSTNCAPGCAIRPTCSGCGWPSIP